MPEPEELQNLLTLMAESEPEPTPGRAEQTEFGTIAWYLHTR